MEATNLRLYGAPPFSVAVVHGGPGAPGSVAPVAKELAKTCGVLEPLQTATSLEGQILELRAVLEKHADFPVTLIGHSWGAWLCYLVAAHYPSFVRKIILVGSGPFESRYASSIMETRLSRLTPEERDEIGRLGDALSKRTATDADLARFGEILSKADSYDRVPVENELVKCDAGAFQGVWSEANDLRETGQLLELSRKIRCPVLAIHGDYDPHPYAGVRNPLSCVLKSFRFVLLNDCGHTPWEEKHARERFFELLVDEIF